MKGGLRAEERLLWLVELGWSWGGGEGEEWGGEGEGKASGERVTNVVEEGEALCVRSYGVVPLVQAKGLVCPCAAFYYTPYNKCGLLQNAPCSAIATVADARTLFSEPRELITTDN